MIAASTFFEAENLSATPRSSSPVVILGDGVCFLKIGGLGGNFKTILDRDDFERLQHFRWYAYRRSGSTNIYVQREISENGKSRMVLIHREIAGCPDGMVVDHINHDSLDNRKQNLRICTSAQNSMNRKGPTRASKTGIRGVSRCNLSNKFRAEVRIRGKLKYLGLFANIHDADACVKKAREKYFGEFCGDNLSQPTALTEDRLKSSSCALANLSRSRHQ